MKADFAYIEQAYRQRLEHELVHPTVPDTAAEDEVDTIAGFVVKAPERAARRRATLTRVRIDHVRNFHKDRDALRDVLQTSGIAPLAILPAEGWRYLCTIGGLYQLHPSPGGEIRVSTRCLDRIERQATWLKWIAFLVLVGATGGALALVAPSPIPPDAAPTAYGVVWFCMSVLAVMGSIIAIPLLLAHPDLGRTGFARLLLRLYDRAPARRIVEDFFPKSQPVDGDRASRLGWQNSALAQLVFPEPPADIVALLRKAHGLDLRIAAAPEAIGFTKPPSAILRPEMTARRAARAALSADPVIYVQEGTAVAILAQYGDFPLERDSVDLAVESKYLL